MKTFKNLSLVAVVAISFPWLFLTLVPRMAAEKNNKTVEIAASFNEAVKLAATNNYPVDDLLDRMKSNGISTMVVEEETVESLEDSGEMFFISGTQYDKLKLLDVLTEGSLIRKNTIIIADAGLSARLSSILNKRYSISTEWKKIGARSFIFLPANIVAGTLPLGFSENIMARLRGLGYYIALKPLNVGNPAWINDAVAEGVSSILLEPKEGFKNRRNFVEAITLRLNYIDFEFFPSAERYYANRSSIVRGHKLHESEKHSISSDAEIKRYMRAVKERGIRFLLFSMDEKKGIDENLEQIKTLTKKLKKNGFIIGKARSPVFPTLPMATFRKFLAVLLATVSPAVLIYAAFMLAKKNTRFIFAFVNVLVIFAGLLTCSFISSLEFMMKLDEVPGIKLIMISSFVLSFLALYSPAEIRTIADAAVKVRHLIVFAFALALAGIIIVRSGNVNFSYEPEIVSRNFLETLFYIRPRWKEILLGQPFLLLGLKSKNRVFLLIGSVAAISAINTFLHAHTPLAVSVYRTALGAVLGGVLGYAAERIYRVVRIKR